MVPLKTGLQVSAFSLQAGCHPSIGKRLRKHSIAKVTLEDGPVGTKKDDKGNSARLELNYERLADPQICYFLL